MKKWIFISLIILSFQEGGSAASATAQCTQHVVAHVSVRKASQTKPARFSANPIGLTPLERANTSLSQFGLEITAEKNKSFQLVFPGGKTVHQNGSILEIVY
jgi:hypothetical protein